MQLLTLLEGLIPPQLEDMPDALPPSSRPVLNEDDTEDENLAHRFSVAHLEKLYVFALVWSMGAFLDLEDRQKFNEFLYDKLSDILSLPQSKEIIEDNTVFGFMVNKRGNLIIFLFQ